MIFIFLLCFSQRFAIRCWIFLVLYSEIVITSLYLYIVINQLSVFESISPYVEGSIYETIGFGSSIWLNLLILIFSLFQNAIIHKFQLKEHLNNNQFRGNLEEYLPQVVIDFYHSMINNAKKFSSIGCYLIFYLVGVLSRYDLVSLLFRFFYLF